MDQMQKGLQGLSTGADVLFLLMGAILVFAMHGGFAFLEVGTVRHKNQVNALCKIIVDFAISTVCYFLIGYWIAHGLGFFASAEAISGGATGFPLPTRHPEARRWRGVAGAGFWRRLRLPPNWREPAREGRPGPGVEVWRPRPAPGR